MFGRALIWISILFSSFNFANGDIEKKYIVQGDRAYYLLKYKKISSWYLCDIQTKEHTRIIGLPIFTEGSNVLTVLVLDQDNHQRIGINLFFYSNECSPFLSQILENSE